MFWIPLYYALRSQSRSQTWCGVWNRDCQALPPTFPLCSVGDCQALPPAFPSVQLERICSLAHLVISKTPLASRLHLRKSQLRGRGLSIGRGQVREPLVFAMRPSDLGWAGPEAVAVAAERVLERSQDRALPKARQYGTLLQHDVITCTNDVIPKSSCL